MESSALSTGGSAKEKTSTMVQKHIRRGLGCIQDFREREASSFRWAIHPLDVLWVRREGGERKEEEGGQGGNTGCEAIVRANLGCEANL